MTDPSDTDIYDFAEEPPLPVQPIVPPLTAPLNYQRKPTGKQSISVEEIVNIRMPLWLLVGGLIIEMGVIWNRSSLQAGAARLGIGLILNVALMFAGMCIASKFRGIRLGSFQTAGLKLAALSVAPAALGDLAGGILNFIPFGGLGIWAVQFVAYFALLGALFDLDESDTWYCICVIFLIQVAAYFALAAIH